MREKVRTADALGNNPAIETDENALAKTLNALLDKFHDPAVSDNPFSWSDAERSRNERSDLLKKIESKLASFHYIPKSSKVKKILLFGVGIPLGLLALFIFMGIHPVAWFIVGAIAIGSGIAAFVIGNVPSLEDEIVLAAYTIPRGWSFSQINSEDAWSGYHRRFSYFNRGDENQYIGTRIWGFMDSERKRPFQMFHFHYDTVEYVPVTTVDSKGNAHTYIERRVTPHERYGIFVALPESKSRFRITEGGSDGGLKKHIKLEYAKLNRVTDVYCDDEDELYVRRFLSPAVEEVVMELANNTPDMVLDFFPGLALIATTHDFMERVGSITLNDKARNFKEIAAPAIERMEAFRTLIGSAFDRIRKYND